MNRRTTFLVLLVAVSLLIGSLAHDAFASAACTAIGGIQSPGECLINTTIAPAFCLPGGFNLTLPAGESLRMAAGGVIDCSDDVVGQASALPITINVTGGNMLMEAGSALLAENRSSGGSGANITVTVSGDFTMKGPDNGQLGAIISTEKTSGAGDTGGGGNIRINVGNVTFDANGLAVCAATPSGNILVEAGAVITAN